MGFPIQSGSGRNFHRDSRDRTRGRVTGPPGGRQDQTGLTNREPRRDRRYVEGHTTTPEGCTDTLETQSPVQRYQLMYVFRKYPVDYGHRRFATRTLTHTLRFAHVDYGHLRFVHVDTHTLCSSNCWVCRTRLLESDLPSHLAPCLLILPSVSSFCCLFPTLSGSSSLTGDLTQTLHFTQGEPRSRLSSS